MCSKMKTCQSTEKFCRRAYLPSDSFSERVEALRGALECADHVVIGAGAGLSAAAGLEYGGSRFSGNFADFIDRYGIPDMYAAMFYPFRTEEERWAYQARHVRLNRFDNDEAAGLYRSLFEMVGGKDHFVVTTNVDGLFVKAGFASERVFAVQGDYAYMQCAVGCHDRLYNDEGLVREMCRQTESCRVPSSLVPRCPVCGGSMEINVRKDGYFVEDDSWRESLERYRTFMAKASQGRTLLLELGVGYNTPSIIRFPFERMVSQLPSVTLARFNRDFPGRQADMGSFIPFGEDIARVLADVMKPLQGPLHDSDRVEQ